MRLLRVFQPHSIRGRLALVSLGILVPALILVSWILARSHAHNRSSTEWQLLTSAKAISDVVDSQLRIREALLHGLATSPALRRGQFEEFRRQALAVLKDRDEWIVLIDDEGRQLLNTRVPIGTDLPRIRFIPEFQQKAQAGETYYSGVRLGPVSNRHLVFVAIPVHEDGRLRYTLNYAIPAETLSSLLRTRHVPPEWIVAVMDRDNVVLARNLESERFVGREATSQMLVGLTGVEPRISRAVAFDGRPTIFAAHRSTQTGWALVVAAPVADVLAPAQRVLWVAVGAAVFTGLAAVFIAGSASRKIVRAIDTLVARTQAVGSGTRFSASTTGIKELDAVAQALSSTAATLAAREQELSDSRDAAVAASRSKDDFIANLSHELRTPLNPALLVASDAAGDPTLPADVREKFATIAQGVKLEARLIDDLLDLTRISRGTLQMNRQAVDVHRTLRDTLEILRHELGQKQLRVAEEFAATRVHVDADPVRLQQVFWNLLKNAIKFTDGGGQIFISTGNPNGQQVEVQVADTGIGMTSEELGRAFQRFSSGDRRYGGLGLGLSISRSIIDLLGGSIAVASEGRQRGTRFTVVLPLCPAPDGHGEATVAGETTPSLSLRESVLLVEDHDASRVVLERLLRRRGLEVTAAATVAAARAAAQEGRFSFVISDIGLPDGTGYTLMSELKARAGHVGIALTGYGMEADVQKAQEAGFIAHITKPVTAQALDHALQRAFEILGRETSPRG